jgi:hypothetical protein
MTPSPQDWTEALAAEHQREAKLIIMQAIEDAERLGFLKGWARCREEAGILMDDCFSLEAGAAVRLLPCPPKSAG